MAGQQVIQPGGQQVGAGTPGTCKISSVMVGNIPLVPHG
jgi:hypothetical protein